MQTEYIVQCRELINSSINKSIFFTIIFYDIFLIYLLFLSINYKAKLQKYVIHLSILLFLYDLFGVSIMYNYFFNTNNEIATIIFLNINQGIIVYSLIILWWNNKNLFYKVKK